MILLTNNPYDRKLVMAVGKVPNRILKRSVVNLLKCPPRTGIDAASFAVGDIHVLTACATGLTDCAIAPETAVYKAANNIWVSGGELLGIEASFMLPKSYNEYNLKAYTKRVKAACDKCKTTLAGGHTEVTDGVKRFCISVAATGIVGTTPVNIHNVKPGMDIIVTKWIALEEVAMIVSNEDNMAKLCEHFSNEYMSVTGQYADWLTVRDEAAVAMKHGVAAMHDISEGGIFTALWDFAEGSGCGFEVDLKRIPLRQETVEIAEFFHLNPYTMKSSGSIIIACDNGTDMVNALNEEGIPAVIIGRTTDNNGKILRNEDEIRYLDKM